jgi:hypothetical protein
MNKHPDYAQVQDAKAHGLKASPPGMSYTHRCQDCPADVEHCEAELCTSCGKCNQHCKEL